MNKVDRVLMMFLPAILAFVISKEWFWHVPATLDWLAALAVLACVGRYLWLKRADLKLRKNLHLVIPTALVPIVMPLIMPFTGAHAAPAYAVGLAISLTVLHEFWNMEISSQTSDTPA